MQLFASILFSLFCVGICGIHNAAKLQEGTPEFGYPYVHGLSGNDRDGIPETISLSKSDEVFLLNEDNEDVIVDLIHLDPVEIELPAHPNKQDAEIQIEVEDTPIKDMEPMDDTVGLNLDVAVDDLPDDEDDEFDSVFNHPGLSYMQNVEQMESVGIDTKNVNPDILIESFLLVPALIERHGYECEVHHLQTSDGYLLEMHRIPKHGAQPVFLMHGLLDSSSTWIIMGPNNGFAYMLSDLGYDVWMGNARGNRYSRAHISLNPDGRRSQRRAFWGFSWHEIGITDLPNMIDYVLERTPGFSKLHYIGHSQGTTSFFVMASERPEYNDKILAMQALAPIAFMSNLRSPFVRASALFLNTLDLTTSVLGMYEFLPHSDMLALGGQGMCHDEAFLQAMCSNILFLIAGFNSAQLNTTMIPVIMGHTPAGASTNQMMHYGQGIRSGRFRQFDHGYISNLLEHGSMRPPSYNLGNIRAPVALHYSSNDWLAEPIDVEELHRGLPNVIGKFLVSDPLFNHLDFCWAIDVRTLLYDRVVNIMRLVEQGLLPL